MRPLFVSSNRFSLEAAYLDPAITQNQQASQRKGKRRRRFRNRNDAEPGIAGRIRRLAGAVFASTPSGRTPRSRKRRRGRVGPAA